MHIRVSKSSYWTLCNNNKYQQHIITPNNDDKNIYLAVVYAQSQIETPASNSEEIQDLHLLSPIILPFPTRMSQSFLREKLPLILEVAFA